jgi:hypothetical protein
MEYVIDPERYAGITLLRGAHLERDEKRLCLMEAVAMLVGEKHSDHPACVSAALGNFGRGLNDLLPHDLRQELKAFIPSLPGTAGDGRDLQRRFMSLDWIMRTWLPTIVELPRNADCHEAAQRLRELDPIVDEGSARDASQLAVKTHQAMVDEAPVSGGSYLPVSSSMYYAVANVTLAIPGSGRVMGDLCEPLARAAERVGAGCSVEHITGTVHDLQLSAIGLYGEMVKA